MPRPMDSGNRCKNAPPISAPADKPTRENNIFSSSFSFIESAKTPTNDRILTKKVLAIIHNKISNVSPMTFFLESNLNMSIP